MNCRRADKWMDQAVDGGLPPAQKAQLEAHLAACPGCRREWEVLQAADAALRVPRPVRAPEGMLTEFRQRLAHEEAQKELRQGAGRPAWPWFWPAVSFAAAGATAVLVISLNLAPSGSPFRPAEPNGPLTEMAGPDRKQDPGIVPPSPGGPSTPSGETRLSEKAVGTRPVGPGPAARPQGAEARTGSVGKKTPPAPAAAVRPGPGGAAAVSGLRQNLTQPSGGGRTERSLARVGGSRTDREPARLFGQPVPAAPLGLEAADAPVPAAPVPAAPREPREPRAPQPDGGSRLAMRGASGGGPIALKLEVQEAQSQVLPPEFNVSPAVLTALRREVEVKVETAPVREALKQITEAADVVVRVDPSVQPLRVTVEQDGAPLWMALQTVAQQGRLQIVPEDNQLLLRPAAPGDAAKPPAGLAGPAGPPAAPPRPEARGHLKRARAAVGQPDRTVWPASWGTLPERGFEPPRPEELPPSVAGLPQAMDEARENNRTYNFRNNSQQSPYFQNKALENGGQTAPVQNRGRNNRK